MRGTSRFAVAAGALLAVGWAGPLYAAFDIARAALAPRDEHGLTPQLVHDLLVMGGMLSGSAILATVLAAMAYRTERRSAELALVMVAVLSIAAGVAPFVLLRGRPTSDEHPPAWTSP